MDEKQNVQKQFGRNADAYVTSTIHAKGKDLQQLLALAELTGNENALDAATGTGHTANAFAPYVSRMTAFDLTPEMLAAAKKFINGNGHANVSFVQGDAEHMPFADDEFDIVTCRIAPHHFPNVERFLSEVSRVLKKNGQFLLDDNTAPEDDEIDQFYNTIEKKRDGSHHRAWKKSEWIGMLERHGFEIDEARRYTKTFAFDDWCGRMQLPGAEKEALNDFILHAPENIRKKLRVKIKESQVVSFLAESWLVKAIRRF
ncbi:MAG TPA: class I SAM-dependent methyltransferase [Bacillales bacterium]|nr:class I SAM-dependent methyltransferase [Bacillales bacterium]